MHSMRLSVRRTKCCCAATFNGGSVNQAMFTYLDHPNTRLVSGVNMSFMMNVLSEDTLSDERLDEIIEESREYLRRVEPEVPADTAPTGSDDFF